MLAVEEDLLVEARWVLPIAAPPIQDGAVLVAPDGTVRAVGRRRELGAARGARRTCVELVLPALANAHVHLELSALRGRVAGGAGLVAWVRDLLDVRGALTRDDVARGVRAAIDELRASGVGALGDVSSGLAGGELPPGAPLEGVRFEEALGVSPGDALALVEATRARPGSGPLRSALAAHSPATCSEELLRAVAVASAGAPVSLHLAEDPAERRLLAAGEGPWAELLRERGLAGRAAPGVSPVALAARAGLLGPRTLAVHCVDLDDEDLATLAASGATAVLCPRSNRFIGGRRPPAGRLVRAGVPLALGTDSLASVESLSPLEDAAELGIAPALALEAATRGGARALGLPGRGAIVPGARPGLVALDLDVGRGRPEEAVLERPRARVTWLSG